MSGAKILKSTSRKALANMLAVVKQNSLSYYNGPLPVKPIHFWHADKDTEIAQPGLVRALVAKWKAAGVQTDYTGFTGDHVDLGARLIPAPIDYFADKVRI